MKLKEKHEKYDLTKLDSNQFYSMTDGGLLVIADTEAINSFLGKKNEEIWIGAFEDVTCNIEISQ